MHKRNSQEKSEVRVVCLRAQLRLLRCRRRRLLVFTFALRKIQLFSLVSRRVYPVDGSVGLSICRDCQLTLIDPACPTGNKF